MHLKFQAAKYLRMLNKLNDGKIGNKILAKFINENLWSMKIFLSFQYSNKIEKKCLNSETQQTK